MVWIKGYFYILMKIDVVCPLYSAGNLIDGFLARLNAQTGVEIQNIVFPVTATEDSDETVEKIKATANCTYFLVGKEEFSHSLTREKALMEYCQSDVVVMMSQDVVLESEDALQKLAQAVNEEVAYAYGKQICKRRSIERYIRNKNYGAESYVVGQEDVERLQLGTFFASDAFSAYYRPTFVALGGYGEHMMMSEDMFYAKKVIDAGYKKAYVADAVVEHAHRYTLKELYNRYYQTGVWFANHPEFDGYKATSSGLSLALYVFKRALLGFNIPVLLRFVPDMTARLMGMKKGKKALKTER